MNAEWQNKQKTEKKRKYIVTQIKRNIPLLNSYLKIYRMYCNDLNLIKG